MSSSNESESLSRVSSQSSTEYHTPEIVSQESVEEGDILPTSVNIEERIKRKRELFESIENSSKTLPPSKRKRSHVLPKSPTDSDERDKYYSMEDSGTNSQPETESQPDHNQKETVLQSTSTAGSSEQSSNNKIENTKPEPRRSTRKKGPKLNKPIENDR